MKCPCEDCLCVPICRHKIYVELVKCSLLKRYLVDPLHFVIRPPERMLKVEKFLKPIIWKPVCNKHGVFIIFNKVGWGA